MNEIAAFMQGRRIVALLVSKDALGPGNTWTEIIQRLKGSLPDVNLVTCHGFSDPINWEELSAAGVFHAIHLPLKENELRQALGFVWEAERRRAESSQPVSVGIPVIQRSVKTEIAS
ncbi:MAG TPA: hypothetical protein VG273_16080 [Bryobacteraceae bacterium]|nr:hypothetical protein [Bryobacteraceae bacterium]